MTRYFKRPCAKAGCRRLALDGSRFCAEHQDEDLKRKREVDKRRGSSSSRGYNSAWTRASKIFLAQHPLCAECQRQGKVTPATEVDHIVPHKGDQALFWRTSNWQALCHSCHSRKTVMEDGGFGRPLGRV